MTTTIKVATAFSLLLTATDKPIRFKVGEHEVEQDVADHWWTQAHLEKDEPSAEAVPALDPATATRDELLAYMRAGFEKHLEAMSDDELRHVVSLHQDDEAEEAEEAETEDHAPGGEPPAGSATDSDPAHVLQTISGGAGNDTITGQGSDAGNDATDTLGGGQGSDSLSGTAGDGSEAAKDGAAETISGGAAPDAVDGADEKKPAKGKGQAKPDA